MGALRFQLQLFDFVLSGGRNDIDGETDTANVGIFNCKALVVYNESVVIQAAIAINIMIRIIPI